MGLLSKYLFIAGITLTVLMVSCRSEPTPTPAPEPEPTATPVVNLQATIKAMEARFLATPELT